MDELQWLAAEQKERALAWRMILAALQSPAITGISNLEDALKYAKELDRLIYEKIGDCP